MIRLNNALKVAHCGNDNSYNKIKDQILGLDSATVLYKVNAV